MVLSIYAIPGRDNGLYSTGGFANRAEYLSFLTTIRDSLGTTPTFIVYEADALGLSRGLNDTLKAERIETLRQGVNILDDLTTTEVYIDASMWVGAAEQAQLLRSVDIAKIAGFSLNVSGFHTQNDCYAYGNEVVAELAKLGITGKKYVIDSARNGNGELTSAFGAAASVWIDAQRTWCNPPGRAIGLSPGLVANQSNCRATLWIKAAGESDGNFPLRSQSTYFADDAPQAGQFWLNWARDFLSLSQPAAVAPTFNTVTSTFSSTFGPMTVRSADITNLNNQLVVPVSSSYSNAATASSYTLKDSAVAARVLVTTVVGTANDASVLMSIESATEGTRLAVRYNIVTGQLSFANEASYYDSASVSIAYSATAHAYWRLRESSGTTYFETSPDYATWIIRKQVTTPGWISSGAYNCRLQFTGYRNSPDSSSFAVDSVNAVTT